MLRKTIYGIGHLITYIALSRPLRRNKYIQHAYTALYDSTKHILERPEHRFFRTHLHAGMTILDIGAHTGCYSRLFSLLVGEKGKVYSFEPDPWSFAVLSNHLGNRDNATPIQLALGDTEKNALFFPNARSRADSSLFQRAHSEEPIEVEMTTIDTYCEHQGIDNIDALKIDVEGTEAAVLRGAETLLREKPPIWIMVEIFPSALANFGTTAEDVCSLLTQHGYSVKTITSQGNPGVPFLCSDANNTQNQQYTNIVAVHPSHLS